MMLYDEIFAGKKVEGNECTERAILPKKVLRKKMAKLIESDFSISSSRSVVYITTLTRFGNNLLYCVPGQNSIVYSKIYNLHDRLILLTI